MDASGSFFFFFLSSSPPNPVLLSYLLRTSMEVTFLRQRCLFMTFLC